MKKIFVTLIFCLICFSSCDEYSTVDYHENYEKQEVHEQRTTHSKLVVFEHNGEKHEFVIYKGFYDEHMFHWPSCKYCKQNEEKTNDF